MIVERALWSDTSSCQNRICGLICETPNEFQAFAVLFLTFLSNALTYVQFLKGWRKEHTQCPSLFLQETIIS